MKNDVAIITLPGQYNYGNRLQNFATSVIYRSLGYSVESINPSQGSKFTVSIKRFAKRLLGINIKRPEDRMSSARLEAFNRFNKLIKTREVNTFDINLKNEYKWFSVGSDQVWNPNYLGTMAFRSPWFFLKFVNPRQRIALSPSIGLDSLSSYQVILLRWGTTGFSRLSIREERGRQLINEATGRDATVICDPTLVVAPEVWRSIASDSLTPKQPYILEYLLGESNSEAKCVLDELEGVGVKTLICLSDQARDGEPDAGPSEFISLVDNAEHVITDSFHAAVFACILDTPLTIVHREGGNSMFSRLENLSKTLGIEHKVYGSKSFELSRAGDSGGVSEAIERERDKFITYLRGCLDA